MSKELMNTTEMKELFQKERSARVEPMLYRGRPEHDRHGGLRAGLGPDARADV